jgi:hypothetical protein
MCEVKKVNPRIKDVVGEVYSRFTIIENLPSLKYGKSTYKRVKALCECGNTRELCYRDLTRSKIKSCGCINTESKVDIEKNNIYNHWTILKEVPHYVDPQGNKYRKVLAECVCGKQSELILSSLRTGSSRSCGCMIEYKSGYTLVTKESEIPEITLEQMNQKELYNWKIVELVSAGMKVRCYKIKNKDYVNYGGRGIKIEDSFNTFAKFYKWMISQGYTHDCKLEIDSKDNDGNYSIDNCRLISKAESNRNTRRNVMTWEIVEDIRYGKYVGIPSKTIAEDIGCCMGTVTDVRNFHTWNE